MTAPVAASLTPLPTLLAAITAGLCPISRTETVPLAAARGRILAEPVSARLPVPAWDNAAVDGYAVAGADTGAARPVRLVLAGRAAAGAPWSGTLQPGHAVRILTGARIPEGTAAVVMQEECTAGDGGVTVPACIRPDAHIRRAGEDMVAGAQVLALGRRLVPGDLGLLAAVGVAAVTVRRRLRVAVFSTGEELREPGTILADGAIFDANRYTLLGSLDELGCAVTDLGVLPDRCDAIRDALTAAAGTHDVILTSGGMSVGDEDHVKAALLAAGGRLDTWRAAIKPGKPVGIGRLGAALFIGLPGNPFAVAVTFQEVARPVLLTLAGAEPVPAWPRFTVASDFRLARSPGRREFLAATLVRGTDGMAAVRLLAQQGSHMLSNLARADVLVELPDDTAAVAPGDPVAVLPLFRP